MSGYIVTVIDHAVTVIGHRLELFHARPIGVVRGDRTVPLVRLSDFPGDM
jgi:hypothetical protein